MSKLLIYKMISPASNEFGSSFALFVGRCLCLVLCLGGCASSAPDSRTADSVESLEITPELSNFVSQGKLSLRPRGEAEFKGFTANYRWEQIDGGYDLELWGALGQGRTHITGDAERIKIVDGTGRVVRSRNPERLLKRHLGWSLPLAVLPYWLQGKGAPAPPAQLMRFQANNDLETMEQLGWKLEFARYQKITGESREQRLPGRVRATSADVKLTVVSREWAL